MSDLEYVMVRTESHNNAPRFAQHFGEDGVAETVNVEQAKRWSSVEAIIKFLRNEPSRSGLALQDFTIAKLVTETKTVETVVRAFE